MPYFRTQHKELFVGCSLEDVCSNEFDADADAVSDMLLHCHIGLPSYLPRSTFQLLLVNLLS